MSEPPITIRAAHGSHLQSRPTRVVIHDEEFPVGVNSAEEVASYFTQQASGGSAHYVVDSDSEQHCVPDDIAAWHAPPNDGSLGIEQDGYARFSRSDWLQDGSRRSMARAAARTAELCIRFGIPVRRIGVQDLLNGAHGVCGHIDVSNAWHQSDHSDPGSQYPWDLFIPLVQDGVFQLGDVKAFQSRHGLVADGDAGHLTIIALGSYLYAPTYAPGPAPAPAPAPAGPGPDRFLYHPQIQLGASDGTPGPGKPVTDLQNSLNVLYHHESQADPARLVPDGDFGPATLREVKDLQFRCFHEVADGIVGPKTWGVIGYLLTANHR